MEPPADATTDAGDARGGSAVLDGAPPPDAPGSVAHKAAAWVAYRQRAGTQGWSYERWSAVYEANMTRARRANLAADALWATVGYGRREVAVTTSDGQARILDIADEDQQIGIEHKTGYQSASVDNLSEIARDTTLIQDGWQIEWIFEGMASRPLRDALDAAGIPYTGGNPSPVLAPTA